MAQIELPIQIRGKNTKNENRRARRNGQLPSVVYGANQDPQAILLDSKAFERTLTKVDSSTIFSLKAEGAEAQLSVLREIQRDPVHEGLVHVDFMRIEADKPIHAEVPVHGTGGTPAGVREGGVFETIIRRVSVRCLPLIVPAEMTIDVSEMVVGDSIHVSDLAEIEGVEMISPPETVLFRVATPRVEVEEEPEVLEEGVEGAVEGEEGATPAEGEGAADEEKKD